MTTGSEQAVGARNTDAPVCVSIVVPCRNEENYIRQFIESVLAQEAVPGGMEVIIADGCSDDGTRLSLTEIEGNHAAVRVLDNIGRIVSTGLNAAVELARGEIIVRLDVHTQYAGDYVRQCVAVLRETGATCVGGAWKAQGRTYMERAIAKAFGSPFGSGGARSRDSGWSGAVDTVYLGAWRKKDLMGLGGFDEQLVRNQDDELNLRITRAGGTVWQDARIRSAYVPRGSFSALFRQFYQYGYWKVFVIRKHGTPASPRHLVPAAGLMAGATLLILGLFAPQAWFVLLGGAGIYLIAAFVSAIRAGAGSDLPVVAAAFGFMHLGYGLGFARGILASVFKRASGHAATRLTR